MKKVTIIFGLLLTTLSFAGETGQIHTEDCGRIDQGIRSAKVIEQAPAATKEDAKKETKSSAQSRG